MGRILRRATSTFSRIKELCGFGAAKVLYARVISIISSFSWKGRNFVHNSMYRRNIDGEKFDHVMQASFSDLTHSFTMFLQAMTPERSAVSCKSHGKHWATKISEFGHSLVVQREILFHNGCFPKAPNISHIFSHGEITCTTSKWWGNHLPYLDLMQAGDAMRWHHMQDYDPPPHAQIYVCVSVVFLPYIDEDRRASCRERVSSPV